MKLSDLGKVIELHDRVAKIDAALRAGRIVSVPMFGFEPEVPLCGTDVLHEASKIVEAGLRTERKKLCEKIAELGVDIGG